MWGQVTYDVLLAEASGIIPTRVGTSWNNISIVKFAEDHPHACGDKVRKALPHTEGDGSSPRVWGQVLLSQNG